ncbi:MAG: class I SAM-dependent methyltransferase [Pseudomonadota bacterium]
MKSKSDLINFIIQQHGFKSYLEIGVLNGHNFKQIQVEHKESIDPNSKWPATYKMTSERFFDSCVGQYKNKTYDVVFIDGSHLSEDAGSDALNARRYLNPTYIIMHDCNPKKYEHQIRQRPRNGKSWYGDVWLAWVALRQTLPFLPMFVVDTDCGCGIIYNRIESRSAFTITEDLTWESLQENRKEWLNLQNIEYFKKFVEERSNGMS